MKFVSGTLRLGIADNTVMDALAIAFTGNKSNRLVLENAYNVSSDLGTVAKVLATRGIESAKSTKITLYKPVRPMLAERVSNAEEALQKMEGPIAAAEYKLDGERIQIHKGKDRVELFSRRLERITEHYPDITKAVRSLKKVNEAIFEGEVVAIDTQTSEFLPFQELMHRRRKYGIQEAMEGYPVILNIFDVLFLDGATKTSLPYNLRRDLIRKIVDRNSKNGGIILVVPQCIVKNPEEIEKFMASAIENG